MNAAMDGWLNNATMDLSDEAVAYIRKQAEKRYAEAYQVELLNGLSPEHAANAAVLQFGSPLRANREYKQRYLSTRQITFLKGILYIDTKPIFYVLIVFLWFVVMYFFRQYVVINDRQSLQMSTLIFFITAFVFSMYTTFIWLPSVKHNNASLTKYLITSLFGYDLSFLCFFSTFIIVSTGSIAGYLLFLQGMFFYTIPKLMIIRKLRIEDEYLRFI